MTFLAGWHYDQNFRWIQIVGLAIFGVCFLGLIINLIILTCYRQILKNYCLALSEAEKIARHPLPMRLKRLSDIAINNHNTNQAKNLRTWEIEYKVIIENKFVEQLKLIQQFFNKENNDQVFIINLHRSRRVLNELKLISQRFYLIQQESEKFLSWEKIQRQTRIEVRNLINELEEESNNQLKPSWLTYDASLLKQRWNHITRALSLINKKIISGDYQLAEAYQYKTNQEIKDLIQWFDLFNQAHQLMTTVWPQKILKISQKMYQRGDFEIEIKFKQLAELKRNFSFYQKQLLQDLAQLNYVSGAQKIQLTSDLIDNFAVFLNFDQTLRDFLNQNLTPINNLVQNLEKTVDSYEAILNQQDQKLPNFFEKQQKFQELKFELRSFNESWIAFYESLTNFSWRADYNLIKVRDLILSLLKKLLFFYNQLIEISKNLRTEANYKAEVESQILILQAVLGSTEVIINQHQHISGLDTHRRALNHLYTAISQIEKSEIYRENRIDAETKVAFLARLDKLIIEALDLKNNLKNRILLQILTDSMLVYLERFSAKPNFNHWHNLVMDAYQENNLVKALNLSTQYIKQTTN